MLNFEIINPTRIVFGKDQLSRLPVLLSELNVKRIMLVYGGGSVERIGLLDRVKEHLSDFELSFFGGVEANPQYHTLMKGVELAKSNQVEFMLAIGGGSVIDGVKFMTGAYYYEGNSWDVLDRKPDCIFTKALPFGTILTLPATGSEANSGAVISREDIKEKRSMGGPLFFPVFSFCDPTVVASLPKQQLANGIVDAFVHTIEQYLTYPSGNLLQERQAEAILQTLIEIGPKVIQHPADYTLAANLMWCATHALNGNLRCGVPTDWATHMIGHELTAHFGIDHARTLAIIGPRLWENQFDNKRDKLIQYGRRVWHIDLADEHEIAKQAILKTEAFFQELEIETRLSAYTTHTDHFAEHIKTTFVERGWLSSGERGAITPEVVFDIVQAAI